MNPMPYRRSYRRHAPAFERLGLKVQGSAEAEQHGGLQRFVRSSNFSIDALGDGGPLVANVARFPALTFAHIALPEVRITWPRDRGSTHRALLLIAASGTFSVDTEGGVLRRGSGLALIRPGEERVSISMSEPQNDLVYIGFGAELLADVTLPSWASYDGPALDWTLIAPFYAYVRTLCTTQTPQSPVVSPLASVSRILLREMIGVITRDAAVPPSLVDAAREVIRAEFSDPGVTVARIAMRLGVAPRTLQAAFAAEGATVSGELRRARVTAARTAKRTNPRMTAREVAAASGFGSVSAMSRAFRDAEAQEAHEAVDVAPAQEAPEALVP